jgi:predicted membrane protein
MKMGSSLFWGIILIIIGLSLVAKVVFNIDFPVFKIVVAFIFIFIGLKIMFGSNTKVFHRHYYNNSNIVFGETKFEKAKHGTEYNVVFSKGNFDFREVELNPEGPTRITINTVFGGSDILIRHDMPVQVKINAAFAGAHLPNGNTSSFGSTIYSTDSLDTSKPYLEINADVVFGGMNVISF